MGYQGTFFRHQPKVIFGYQEVSDGKKASDPVNKYPDFSDLIDILTVQN